MIQYNRIKYQALQLSHNNSFKIANSPTQIHHLAILIVSKITFSSIFHYQKLCYLYLYSYYLGKNYELSDLPGFDSPLKEHRDANLRAIELADAFLFLTDGQRVSLTEPQITLLKPIQGEPMQRAFGIITNLERCETKSIYNDHYKKARQGLVDIGFKEENIYKACLRVRLLDKHSEEHQSIMNKIKQFDGLENGFEECHKGLKNFIEYELPKTHLKQLIELIRDVSRYVTRGLDIVKKVLPIDSEKMRIDDYIKNRNIEKWDEDFDKKFYEPIFAEANFWQKTEFTKNRAKFLKDTKDFFLIHFNERTIDFIKKQHPVEKRTFEKHGFTALHPYSHPTEDEIREELCFELEENVIKTSDDLAQYLYDIYIFKLENKLNKYLDEYDLYRTKLTLQQCKYELLSLVLRVCRPVITATLRFSHLNNDTRQDAINQLIYIAPIVAYNLCASDSENEGNTSSSKIDAISSKIAEFAPKLVQGIAQALGIYPSGGIIKLTLTAVKLLFKRLV